MNRGQEGFKITDQVKWDAKPSHFVGKLCDTFVGVLEVGISDFLQ